MSIPERVSEAIARQEEKGHKPIAILLSDEAFAELEKVVKADHYQRQAEGAKRQQFLNWLHTKHGTEHKQLDDIPVPNVTWNATLFGLPIKRYAVQGNVIAVKVST